jgi:hypothetical protein
MNMKASLAVLIILLCTSAIAQPKAYTFSEIQCRNHKQQWQEFLKADEDCVAYFSEQEIALNIDKLYHLSIKTTTHLPNKGTIYLCKDDNGHDVTITLIGNDRMFVYNNETRFLINFDRKEIADANKIAPKPVASAANSTVATTED